AFCMPKAAIEQLAALLDASGPGIVPIGCTLGRLNGMVGIGEEWCATGRITYGERSLTSCRRLPVGTDSSRASCRFQGSRAAAFFGPATTGRPSRPGNPTR